MGTRKSIRLKHYDYAQAGCYFVTICAKDKHELFGRVVKGQLLLSEFGHVVKREIETIPQIRNECAIEKFVIMPNHIHLIVRIVGDDGNRPADDRSSFANHQADCDSAQRADCHPPLRRSLSNMVQGFKGAVTRKIGFSLWQRSFHDHIIRSEADYWRIWQYIDENPRKWTEDCYFIRESVL